VIGEGKGVGERSALRSVCDGKCGKRRNGKKRVTESKSALKKKTFQEKKKHREQERVATFNQRANLS